MPIKSSLLSIEGYLSSSYDALESAGADIPKQKNAANLAPTIRSISHGEYGSIQFYYNDDFTTYVITDSKEYEALGAKNLTDASDIELGGMSIKRNRISRYQFGADCNYIPKFFLANTSVIGIGPLPNIQTISEGFLANTRFNQTFTIPNSVTAIESYFLSGSSFGSSLVLPVGIKSIGDHFMYNCQSNVGPLRVSCNAWPTDQYSLSSVSNSVSSYTTGVSLVGTYASAWKSALPNRTSTPYRKIIVN